MSSFLQKHRNFWSEKTLVIDVLIGLLFLVAAVIATYYANLFTFTHASNSVTDIILDNIPTINVDFVFNEGALIFIAFLALIVVYEPKRLPFVLKSIALFILIRSLFMILTHLAPPPNGSYLDTKDILFRFSSGDDLFFSAHTGLPFLMALTFWRKKYLRYFFLVSTVVGATAVLLGHLHYSIDVFSAVFITFGIFHLAQWIFPPDYALLKQAL